MKPATPHLPRRTHLDRRRCATAAMATRLPRRLAHRSHARPSQASSAMLGDADGARQAIHNGDHPQVHRGNVGSMVWRSFRQENQECRASTTRLILAHDALLTIDDRALFAVADVV